MKSNVIVAKHPLHPMLIPIPIAAYLMALGGDLAYVANRRPFWQEFSTWAMRIGTVGGVLAAVPGLIDYGTVVPRQAKKHATLHGLLNVGAVSLFAGNLALRSAADTRKGKALGATVGLTAVGCLALAYSGWLGGHLVYEHKVGVPEEGEPEPANFRITFSEAAREEAEV